MFTRIRQVDRGDGSGVMKEILVVGGDGAGTSR